MKKIKEKLISVKKAKKIMIDSLEFLKNSSESINFNITENRVLAENIYSKQNIPKYDNSAIDGFAIKYSSFKKSRFFKVVGESKPGKPFKKIKRR